MTQTIGLDDLPTYSPWTARLLAGTQMETVDRSDDYVRREYSQKYGRLRWARTMEEARKMDLGPDRKRLVAMSIGDDLVAAPLSRAMGMPVAQLAEEIRMRNPRKVLDLGCGYGYLLWYLRRLLGPDAYLIGGDSSGAAMSAFERLLVDDQRTSFSEFSFAGLRHPIFEVNDPAVGSALVVTSFALHQLPSAAPVLDVLSYYRNQIETVVCFEPEEDEFGSGMLGQLRRLYGRTNGYSADLLRCLDKRDDVEIEKVYPNVIGANALLPATLSVWRFK